jgi:hypothetical protein
MKFVYSDGGRANCGFKSPAGDCVARAVSIASQIPYSVVYNDLAIINAKMSKTKRRKGAVGQFTASHGIYTTSKLFKDYMKKLGFVWTACMKPGTGCKVHLDENELPSGRLVVRVSRHLTAVIDGVIYDTHNPQREASFQIEPDKGQELKKGQWRNENGVVTLIGKRCVYGYWEIRG